MSPDPKYLSDLSLKQRKELLDLTVDDTIKKFKDKYVLRGDRIAYLSSVYSDKKATHAHIYLMPYTKNGKYLIMNADRYVNIRQRVIAKTDRMRDPGDKMDNKLDKLKVMAGICFLDHLVLLSY
ncbi:hypothetical protein ACFLZV_03505 [Candidatus Margulisiibacteriota bacterium]